MRLPVILNQNAPASGSALAQDLVGNLIGRAGLDLTLVDRFDSIAEDSTDRMTLDGITVPSAVLDWRTESEILQRLSEIEFHGVRSPHQLDPQANNESTSDSSKRRLFLFDLSRHEDANQIIAELDRLRQSLSVKTFSLGTLAEKTLSENAPSEKLSGSNESSAKPSVAAPAAATDRTEPALHPTVSDAPPIGEARSDKNLDNLIDQLDNLDV